MSILAVASSRIMILDLLRIALHMQINYFSPLLRLDPFSSIAYSIPLGSLSIKSYRLAFLSSFIILSLLSESWVYSVGSMLNMRVALNIDGSWGIIVIFSLKISKGTSAIFTPSINIWPENNSMILVKARAMVDCPAPVRPTIPIFSPGCAVKLMPLRTKSVVGLYLSLTSLNSTLPWLGHYGFDSLNYFACSWEYYFSWGTLKKYNINLTQVF